MQFVQQNDSWAIRLFKESPFCTAKMRVKATSATSCNGHIIAGIRYDGIRFAFVAIWIDNQHCQGCPHVAWKHMQVGPQITRPLSQLQPLGEQDCAFTSMTLVKARLNKQALLTLQCMTAVPLLVRDTYACISNLALCDDSHINIFHKALEEQFGHSCHHSLETSKTTVFTDSHRPCFC